MHCATGRQAERTRLVQQTVRKGRMLSAAAGWTQPHLCEFDQLQRQLLPLQVCLAQLKLLQRAAAAVGGNSRARRSECVAGVEHRAVAVQRG